MQRDKQILTLFWKNKKTSTRIRTYRLGELCQWRSFGSSGSVLTNKYRGIPRKEIMVVKS
jgi:hypothetical protein